MDVLTVTCDRDLEQMILQAESIDKFVIKPCRHWVFINEKNPNIKKWHSKLQPFYTRHELIIEVADTHIEVPYFWSGWITQQIHKILMSKKIQDDYLVLDAKNFFIKPVDIDDFQDDLGITSDWDWKNTQYRNTVIQYCKKLGIEPNFDLVLGVTTPFLIKKSVIDHYGDLDQFAEWFLNDHYFNPDHEVYSPSEFIYYSIVSQKHNLINIDNFKNLTVWETFWIHDKDIFDSKLSNAKENLKIIGLHREVLKKLDNKEKNAINMFLKDIGLTTQLTYFYEDEYQYKLI